MKMENKVLVKIIVSELDVSYDVFIPVNEIIWKIKKLLVKSLSDVMGGVLDPQQDYLLINKDNGTIYNNNDLVIDTDIRNTTELLFISNVNKGE